MQSGWKSAFVLISGTGIRVISDNQ